MGPILGPVHAQDPSNRSRFNPDDHRIVSLGLHLNVDEEMDYDVEVGMWWRSRSSLIQATLIGT